MVTTDQNAPADLAERANYFQELHDSKDQMLQMTVEYMQNTQNELSEANEELETMNKSLASANAQISSSINAGRKLQGRITPKLDTVRQVFPNIAIIDEPKHIISGDVYWFDKIKRQRIAISVDCTGHGVPGAMMSFMAKSIIDRIVKFQKVTKPNKILQCIDDAIDEMLSDSKGDEGMEVAVLSYDPLWKVCRYAATHAYAYHYETATNDMHKLISSGIFLGHKSAKRRQIKELKFSVKPGDRVFLASDGIPDQFGGPDDRKFGRARFVKTIKETNHLSVKEQREEIYQTYSRWKDKKSQTDDIQLIIIQF